MATSKKATPKTEPTELLEIPQSNVQIIDFSDDVKNLLRALTTAIVNQPAPIINLTTQHVVPDMRLTSLTSSNLTPIASGLETPAEPVKAPKTSPIATVEATEAVSLTKIRETITTKVANGQTNAIVALLGKFGAKNASTLLEEHFGNFYTELITL